MGARPGALSSLALKDEVFVLWEFERTLFQKAFADLAPGNP